MDTPQQMLTPQGIAIDAQGNLLVADSGNHRIVKWSSNGTLLSVIGGPGEGNGEAAAPAGACQAPPASACPHATAASAAAWCGLPQRACACSGCMLT